MLDPGRNRTRCTLSVYILCFAIGAFNHARDFAELGWRPYNWGPGPLEAFWTSLIGLDLAVVVLLLTGQRRLGVVLAAIVMTVDVAANTYALLGLGISSLTIPLLLQTAFFGFILGSISFLWTVRNVSMEETVTMR